VFYKTRPDMRQATQFISELFRFFNLAWTGDETGRRSCIERMVLFCHNRPATDADFTHNHKLDRASSNLIQLGVNCCDAKRNSSNGNPHFFQ
jgi:hypothetical protein